jgi:AsmA-like C-terminal region
MRRKTMVVRLRKLGLGFLACSLFAALPMYFTDRRSDERFVISSVIASPRDAFWLAAPVKLSNAPDLTLTRGVLYDYGPSASGGSMSHIVLDAPVLTLDVSGVRASAAMTPAGAPVVADPGLLSPLIRQLAALGFDQVTIRRGTLNVAMADGTVETLSDIQAELRQRKGQIETQGSFVLRGQRLAFTATLGQPPDRKAPQRWPLQASFSGKLIQGTFTGHADLNDDLRLSGEADFSTPSLRRIAGWFGIPLQTTQGFNAATIKGELAWARRSLAFEKAQVTVDSNEANGRLVLNLAGERPLIDATLDFSRLELAPYVEAARPQFLGFDLPGMPWASFDISLPLIRYLDADLRISTRKVALMGYAFGQGAATITAQGGKLRADVTELELNSGTLSAQVTANMSEVVPTFALRAKIENIETGPTSALLLGTTALAGRASLSADLKSSGYSLSDVVRRLAGTTRLAMPEGGRLALDLKALREGAKAGSHGWRTLAKSHISVDRLQAQARFVDGVAHLDAVEARSGALALTASGRLGLDDASVDLRLTLKPDAPADLPPKPGDITSNETVSLRGPWRDPVLRNEQADPAAPPPP